MDKVCDRCHGVAVFDVGGKALCEDCYGIVGSCCLEFDGDDLFLEEKSWWETRILTKP